MNSNRRSIKLKTFAVFFVFAIILLGVLWLFQIIYLKDFYKMIKRNETVQVLEKVENLLETSDNCDKEIDELAASNNMGILVADKEGEALYVAEHISNSEISSLPPYMFSLFRDSAVSKGGDVDIEYIGSKMQNKSSRENFFIMKEKDDDLPISQATPEEDKTEKITVESQGRIQYTIPNDGNSGFKQNVGNEMAESVIYVRVREINGVERVIMINSVLTPVDATVSTLKVELKYITIIILLIAFLLAFLVSRNISHSIVMLNVGAKKLAAGDYTVHFESNDYKEVGELSDTLNYAARELGKADRLQKELIANVSHDLRTPLTMIKGYAEVMRDIPGENTPENVQVVIDETERLSSLVNDMLDISKLKAGTMAIHPEEYNITESIRHLLERYNKLREVDGFTIDFIYDDEVEIYADEQMMNQVIYNLVNNAINYTGHDKTVKVVQKVIDKTLRVEVTDTGEGVSQEDIPYVWDRYYKAKTVRKNRKLQGTGLGLSIVKNILELHGAKYGVSSVKGNGATFWFEITINPFDDE